MDQTAAAAVHARNILTVIAENTPLRAQARRCANGGWEVLAVSPQTGEVWRVLAPHLYEAVCELAEQVGFDLDE